jgi:hypothetical protein
VTGRVSAEWGRYAQRSRRPHSGQQWVSSSFLTERSESFSDVRRDRCDATALILFYTLRYARSIAVVGSSRRFAPGPDPCSEAIGAGAQPCPAGRAAVAV